MARPLEGGTMAEYRAYTVGRDGHFADFKAIICRDDREGAAR